MQRSVRREDLESDQSSSSASPQPEVLEKLKSLHDLDYIDRQTSDRSIDDGIDDAEDDLAFNLFAPTSKAGQTEDVKIRLRSPTPDTREPGFVQPERSIKYYLSTLSEEQQQSYFDTALSSDQVLQLANLGWPGMAYPWRTMHLQSSSLSKSAKSESGNTRMEYSNGSQDTKRRRKGKKTRIKLRTQYAAAKTKKLQEKAAHEAREAAKQANKTRKNREKQLKQRAREKAKKAAAASAAAQNTASLPVGEEAAG